MQHNQNSYNCLISQHISSAENRLEGGILDRGRKYSFHEIDVLVDFLICQYDLLSRKNKTSRILCLFDSSLVSYLMLLAIIKSGHIPCLIFPEFFFSKKDIILEQAKPDIFCVIDGHENLLADFENKMVFSDKCLENVSSVDSQCVVHKDEDEIAVIFFTSGTTGEPKLVTHSHGDIHKTNALYAKNLLKINSEDMVFSTSRMFFAYGFNALVFALYNGGKYILPSDGFSMEHIENTFILHKPTVFFAVPTVYALILQKASKNFLINSTRCCISAGERLSLNIFDAWLDRFGKKIIDGIGTTEMLCTFITNSLTTIIRGSIGRILKGFTAKICNDQGQEVKSGDIGVLYVTGPTYSSCQDKETVWFKTNDLFSIDAEGNYFYHGRANDLIKVNGIWVYPYNIEDKLRLYQGVREVAVSSRINEKDMVELVAYIVADENCKRKEVKKQILDSYNSFCNKFEKVREVIFIKNMPRTASGKLMRYKLANIGKLELEREHAASLS